MSPFTVVEADVESAITAAHRNLSPRIFEMLPFESPTSGKAHSDCRKCNRLAFSIL